MKKRVQNYLLLLCIPFSIQAATFEDKIRPCATCHGSQGITANAAWPHLAGQYATYLIKQLQDYQQNHGRNSTIMSPMSAALTQTDMAEIATFYASLPAPKPHLTKKYQRRGEQLYRRGDFNQHIPACITCHGPKGTGNAQAGFPWVSGQHPAYTIQQLQAFKTKERHNDLHGIMQDISSHMNTEDMTAVAYYLQGLE